LKLRIEGKVKTLVYYERPNFVKAKDTTSDVKSYSVADNELLPFLEKSLGVKALVDKRREVWRKSNTVFHIDNVKGVGGIFETELQKKGRITMGDKKLFKSYQDKLLPFLGDVIKGSNVDLIKKCFPK
jgi:adenylate cyclase class IV